MLIRADYTAKKVEYDLDHSLQLVVVIKKRVHLL